VLHRCMWDFKASCALTLALKQKIRTMRAVFIKFGPLLPSLIKLAKMWINYWWGFELPKLLFPTFLTLALFTVPIIGCCIKHQLRSVKEVRYKMRLGNTPMGINIFFIRPLCHYHHKCLHSGKLLHCELKLIYNLRG